MIEDFHKITDAGEKLYPGWWKSLEGTDLSDTLKPAKIIWVRWTHNGALYKKEASANFMPQPIPDGSGLLNVENGQKDFVFYEPDLKERFRIIVPVQVSHPRNGEPHFYYARFKSENKCEILFFDGFGDSVGDLDLNTGEVTNVKETRI